MKKSISILLTMGILIGALQAATVMADELQTEIETEIGMETGGPMTGAWELPANVGLTGEAEKAFQKATEELTGVSYTPLALLGTQIVAGTNYSILCRAEGVYPGAEPYYAILYIYEGLEGETEILRIQDLELNTDEAAQEYGITIRSGEELITSCPKAAKAGETVRIETFFVTDATLTVEIEDVEGGYFISEGVYEFVMPEHDVIVDADLKIDEPGA